MITFVIIVCSIIAISSVVASCIFYKNVQKEEELYEQELDRKYIKNDFRLYNAAYEAYQYAKKENRDFEAQKFKELLEELKGKR